MSKKQSKKKSKARKKQSAKVSAVSGRRQCQTVGCRKLRADESAFCSEHGGNGETAVSLPQPGRMAGVSPNLEGIKRIEEVENYKFQIMDAELRNFHQGFKLLSMEMVEAERVHRNTQEQRKQKRDSLQQQLNNKQTEYNDFIKRLATKHGIAEPKYMVIDTDTRVVRDIRDQQQAQAQQVPQTTQVQEGNSPLTN